MPQNDKKTGNGAKKRPLLTREQQRRLQEGLIYTRYLLPLLTGAVLLVMSFFYNIRAAQGYMRYSLSLSRLYTNTVSAARSYFISDKLSDPVSAYYTLLLIAAGVGLLFFLLAAFFNTVAAVFALRALPKGHESEEASRYKLYFKMAFPNRFALALANCLWLVPALYPTMLSYIGGRFLLIQGVTRLYISRDLPLIAVGVMTALSLLLALCISRLERRLQMNMFLIWHAPEEESEEEEEGE